LIATDSSPLPAPSVWHFTRRIQRELESFIPGILPHLRQVSEVGRRPGAVEKMKTSADVRLKRMTDHRTQRRDAGSTGDEQKLALRWIHRKDEVANRPLHREP
jgi:hypothetical protein